MRPSLAGGVIRFGRLSAENAAIADIGTVRSAGGERWEIPMHGFGFHANITITLFDFSCLAFSQPVSQTFNIRYETTGTILQ